MDTAKGGFYVNKGILEFRRIPTLFEELSESDSADSIKLDEEINKEKNSKIIGGKLIDQPSNSKVENKTSSKFKVNFFDNFKFFIIYYNILRSSLKRL